MKKRFEFTFQVGEDLLTTVISLLSGHISNMEISEIAPGDGPVRKSRSAPDLNNHAKAPSETSKSWQTAVAFLAKLKKGETFRREDFAKHYTAAGFNEKSYSPMLTHLRRAELIDKVDALSFKKL